MKDNKDNKDNNNDNNDKPKCSYCGSIINSASYHMYDNIFCSSFCRNLVKYDYKNKLNNNENNKFYNLHKIGLCSIDTLLFTSDFLK